MNFEIKKSGDDYRLYEDGKDIGRAEGPALFFWKQAEELRLTIDRRRALEVGRLQSVVDELAVSPAFLALQESLRETRNPKAPEDRDPPLNLLVCGFSSDETELLNGKV
jgi:hypothetical protein